MVLLMLAFGSINSFAENVENFRTPAKLYAGAYTVKIHLKKDLTEYDVPVWIKPDQAESTLDASLLKDLGYTDKELSFQDVKISGQSIDHKKFKNQKTEWAFVPDFAKACCYGVLGRDILEDFQIRFDPNSPAHMEWNRVTNTEKRQSYESKFVNELKKLFSLQQANDVPYLLNLSKKELTYEGKTQPPKQSLFSFFFVPPERVIKVMGVLPKDSASAKKVGFNSGLVISHINSENVSGLDRWVIEKYLRGEKGSTIKLISQKGKEFSFDFNSREFQAVSAEKK
jgi:hypothetical protein